MCLVAELAPVSTVGLMIRLAAAILPVSAGRLQQLAAVAVIRRGGCISVSLHKCGPAPKDTLGRNRGRFDARPSTGWSDCGGARVFDDGASVMLVIGRGHLERRRGRPLDRLSGAGEHVGGP